MRHPHTAKSFAPRTPEKRHAPDDEEREEKTQRRGRLDPARVVATPILRRVLGHVSDRSAVLAAQREALQQTQAQEQNGSSPADGLERGHQADREGREAHDHDRPQERVLAADQVADPAEHECAERPHQESGRINSERGKQSRGVITFGEEQRREERRQRRVQIEVVPFENGAERRGEDDSALLRLRAQLHVSHLRSCCRNNASSRFVPQAWSVAMGHRALP